MNNEIRVNKEIHECRMTLAAWHTMRQHNTDAYKEQRGLKTSKSFDKIGQTLGMNLYYSAVKCKENEVIT